MKKNKFLIIAFLFFVIFSIGRAQVGINTENPESTFEIRKIDSYESYQGLLLPRLTEDEINTMTKSNPLPPEGLMVYNTTKQCVYIYKRLLGWHCVEFNKQSLAFEYIGESGTWMKGLTTTASNTVTFRVTNNLSIPISGQNLNNALTLLNVSGGAYTITPIRDYSLETFPAGQYKDYTYKIIGYTPTTSGEALTVKFSHLEKEVSGNIIIKDQIGVQPIDITFNGDYITNKKFDSNNTITLKIKNFTNTSYSNIDLSNAIHLNFPGGGIQIVPGQNSSVEIPFGEKSFTYQLEGTPLASGVINASFVSNANVIGILSKSQVVSDLDISKVKVTEMKIEGVYIEGTNVDNSNYVNVTLKNDNDFPLEHLDLSKALKFNVGSGVSVVAGQHTNVSINANGTITLKYELVGTPSGSTLEAIWDHGAFGAITKTEPIKTQLRVQPDFLADVNATGVYTQEVNIYPGAGNTWSITNIAQLPSWVEINTTSGIGQTPITIKLKEHTTSEVKITNIIVKRNFDGAIGKIIVTKPATNELRVSFFSAFSINGETQTITVTNDTSSSIGTLLEAPDWIESVKLNEPSGTLVIKTKPRTTPGPELKGNLVFTYGPGGSYVYRKDNIIMRPKAQLCPDTPPHFILTPYYRIKYLDDDSVINVRLAYKAGLSNFDTYTDFSRPSLSYLNRRNTYDYEVFKLRVSPYNSTRIEKDIVNQSNTESYLFARLNFNTEYLRIWGVYSHGALHSYQEDTYRAKLSIIYQRKTDLSPKDNNVFNLKKMYLDDFMSDYVNGNEKVDFNYTIENVSADGTYSRKSDPYTLDNMPANFIKVCICSDGGDENTTNKP